MQSPKALSAEESALIERELAIHERVKFGVRDVALARRGDLSRSYAKGISDLRDQASSAHTRDLPALFDQLHSSQMLAQRTSNATLPDMRSPYFAHINITDEGGGTRDVLIGHDTFISTDHDIFIIDWKNAPLAKVYFNFRAGDDYEVETNDERTIRGKLNFRYTLQFEMGKLIGLSTGQRDYHVQDEQWVAEDEKNDARLAGGEGQAMRGFGTGKSGRPQMDVAALLDEQQYNILQADSSAPLLVLGGAGSGKTTIALHRVAHLFANDPSFFAQHKMLVLVPEPGLVRLSKRLLASLRMERVAVATYDDWLFAQAKYVLPGLAKRLNPEPPPRVMRLKRHPAVFTTFPMLAEIKLEKLARTAARKLSFIENADQLLRSQNAKNLSQKIALFCDACMTRVASEPDEKKRKAYERVIGEVRDQMNDDLVDLSGDRIEVFSNPKILAAIVAAGAPQLDELMITEVSRHMRDQITAPEGPKLRDIDAEFALALDETEIGEKDDLEDELYNTIDVDDLTVLFELLRFYTGGLRAKGREMHRYAHMVLDEAQEMSRTELRLLGQLLEKGGSVTIAGDAVQQTDPSSVFDGWEQSLEALGFANVRSEHLKTSYRCPEPIMNFAYDILGPAAPAERPKAKRQGVPVTISRASSEGHATAMMLEALEELSRAEPRASVAIICADFESAKTTYRGLRELSNIRLIRDGAFEFKPGIDVADINQVKGLEFDYVIIPDADIYHYPDTPDHRRMLHVAATRAIHQLWVITVKMPTHIIPKESLQGLHNTHRMP